MNKYLLLFIALAFLQSSLNAQRVVGNYRVDMKEHLSVGDHANEICDRKLTATFQDNTTMVMYDYSCGENYDVTTPSTRNIPATNRIIKYVPHYHRKWGGCFLCTSGDDENNGPTINIVSSDYANCSTIYKTGIYPSNTFNIQELWITNTPILTSALIQPFDNAFPDNDPITILAPIGFESAVYNWQFSTDASTWLQFPSQYQGLDSVNLTANQLFAGSGFNAGDYIGKNIYVRLSACGGGTNSDVITYNIRKSPPNITNATVTPPNCFDTNDGKVTFTFDRALAAGESMLMNLDDNTHPGLIYSREMTNSDLDANHAYTFPDDLQPANYQMSYQGRYVYADGSGSTIVSQSNIKQGNSFDVVAPTAVSFTTSKVDVWCYAGNDGTITIDATGGVGNYRYMVKRNGQPDSTWYPFSSATQNTITGLTANSWQVRVRDGNQCYSKTGAGGSTVTQTLAVAQPSAALKNNTVAVTNPTGYGLSDGSIEVEVSGGTVKPDGSYNFQWVTLAGTLIKTGITTNVTGTGYRVKLDNLPNGTYVLGTIDNNNSSATNHQGCMDTDTFSVVQPQPLGVKINIRDSILCMGDANGSLVAHGTGGIRSGGKPYTYTWKKKNGGGTYSVLPPQTDSVATNLTTGWYAINIRDANGITLANDSTFFLPEPTLLQVGITNMGVTCSGLPNGSAVATATGGTPYYTYAWNTGGATTSINNLSAGTYLVYVKDRNGCQVQKNVVIQQPNAMSLTFTEQQPVCNNSCDGKLTANLTGGTSPYTYQWLGSSSTSNMAPNLCSGIYQVAIIDGQGCSISLRDTLANPSPLPLSLGADRFICAGQNIAYNITIPNRNDITYQWTGTSGFTSSQPVVTLTGAGAYYASVADANNCNSRDTVVLTSAATTIGNEFALPTQAFVNEQIVVVNTSNPAADSVKWIFPSQGSVIQQSADFATFNMPDTGTYYLKFITYRGLCFAEQTKKIIVSQRTDLNNIGSTKNPFITSFTVAPNPSNGSFSTNITLQARADIELRLINILTNQITILSHQSGFDSYAVPIHVSATPGTYILLLETPNGTASMKIVIL